MRKAIFPLLSLLLLGASNLASGVTVTLLTDNTRSGSGALSFQAFKTCAPAPGNGCYNPANSWNVNNNVTGSDATWDWNSATGTLTSTGTFWTTSFLGSNPSATSVISDKTVGLTINTTAQTTTATSYNCVEGNFLAGVGANGCLNVSIGTDFVTSSTALYNVGGDANCVQRTIAGDDSSTGNPRGLFTADAAGVCDAVDGAYDLYTVVSDDTATGGNLVISNGTDIGTCLVFTVPACAPELASAGAHWLTFGVASGANDDGPIDVQQAVPTSIDVLANDVGFTDPVTVTVSTPPTKGTATVVGTSPGAQAGITIEYTSNAGATGPDTFSYTVQDAGNTGTATVSVNILAGASDDTATTTRNSGPININVGANDGGFTDPVTLTIAVAPDAGGTATPPVGTVALANGIISYTPATTDPGTATYTETFTYQVTDNTLTDTAVVRVTVTNAVPDAMVGALTISTQGSEPLDKTATFTAPGAGGSLGNAPSAVMVTAPGTKGIATVMVNVITYTITDAAFFTGTDTFTYTITDADGVTDSADVTVTIAPETPAVANRSFTTTEGTASAPQALGITLGNGSQAQHDISVSTQATNGTCALNGTSLTYTPNAAYTGGDSCVVTITDEDGAGQSGTGTMTITVNAAGGGGGGGGGASLPSSSGFDLWSLSLLAGISWLRRKRLMKPRRIGASGRR